MNAVNLIPSDSRRRRANISTGRPTLALMGGLLVALVAAVLYVSAANDVTTRKSELAQVTASAASWRAAATSYAPFVTAAQQRTQQLAAVRQLAAARFPWSQLLSQIGGLMPAASELTSLQATTTAGTGTGTAAAAASATPQPTVQLSGCAASHSMVAQTMVQLHRVQGVSAVTLSSSSDTSSSGSASGAASSATGQAGSGGCAFPVQFQVSLTLGPTSTVSGGASTASAAPTSGGTPATSTAPTSSGASTGSATPTSSPAPAQ